MGAREELLRVGREMFADRGFKGTSVAELTGAAGIAVGSFYRHFGSKEQLFVEIFLAENARLKSRIMNEVSEQEDPVAIIREVVALNMAGMRDNPILAAWYDKELFARLEKDFAEQGGVHRSLAQVMDAATVDELARWKSEGKLRDDVDEPFVVALLTAVAVVDVHKEEIGVEHFPRLVEFLTEAVMTAVTAR